MDSQTIANEEEIFSQSPVPQTNNKPDTLDFPDALRELMKGKKITKLEWNNKSIFGFIGIDEHLKINLKDKLSDWILSEADILGTDWIVLEETN